MAEKDFLEETGALVGPGHIVYKKGTHGSYYIDKRQFKKMGSRKLVELIQSVGRNALQQGLMFENGIKEVGVIGPAYGAIPFSLPLADYLENHFPQIRFFPANTELFTLVHADGKIEKKHIISEKDLDDYKGKHFIIFEDIVNNGVTSRIVKPIFENDANAKVVAVLCFVDRGGQTKESLGVEQYFPYCRVMVSMEQKHASDCLDCQKGVPIRTDIGLGKEWVDMFGQPPYAPDTDFSIWPYS